MLDDVKVAIDIGDLGIAARVSRVEYLQVYCEIRFLVRI